MTTSLITKLLTLIMVTKLLSQFLNQKNFKLIINFTIFILSFYIKTRSVLLLHLFIFIIGTIKSRIFATFYIIFIE